MIWDVIRELMSLNCLLALSLGTLGGLIIGALPGLSANMGLALLIPFTYGMETTPAMIMLGGVFVAAVYGGSFSAILIHTPGTPASAATAMDGYALTRQGKGLQAIGISTIASVIGGLISGIALLLGAPQLVKVALLFSTPEYFLIAIFGLTIVGGLSGDEMLKGLIAAGFGLMVGMVGMNTHPFARYTFGLLNLQGGIDLAPAMIGLFSLSQVLIECEKRAAARRDGAAEEELRKSIERAKNLSGSFFPTWREFRDLLPTILRASVIGTLVGILPGAGGSIGGWLGYNDAKSRSRNKELFGHGSLEGVAGSEAGNNAVCGGALIPALTMGIPGSGAAAIILGALMLQGFSPGYALFTKYGTMTYSILVGFCVANVLMGVFGFMIAKHSVRLASLPMSILMPVILVLSTVGSFAIKNDIFDVYVMVFFGVVGYLMRKYGFPTAPVVLAMILGPMAERNLINSIQMSKVNIVVYYFSRPLCWILIVLILVSLFSPSFSKWMKRRKAAKAAGGTGKM